MIDDVKAAQAGDRAAFSRLVARFQAMAVAYAVGWAGNQAEDVAQDAFVDAFLHLGQLEEAGAFPAWLRRIVRKHCDRRTRRKHVPAEAGASVALLPDEASLDRGWLLRAVGSLPEHERVVVALHYLAGESQKDIAEFLELPVSTIKKRLFAARTRLREQEVEMRSHAPTSRFVDRIELFLAVRAGDVVGASTIFDRQSELFDAEEQWTAEEAFGAGLPIAHRVSPLVFAVSRGDLDMLRMLLARGAQVEQSCGCPNAETALWIASRCGHSAIVQALLAAGANPDARNQAGYRPAEVAELRAAERVRVVGTRIETGIKAVDLLAPLEMKMLVRVHGQAGTGLMALLAELTSRFDDAVWLSFARGPWQERELSAFAADTGIRPSLGGNFRDRALFVFGEEGRRAELDALLPQLRDARIAFVIDPWAEAMRKGVVPALSAPFDALIATDPELARAGVYPAIDRRNTRSNAAVSPRHGAVANAVRGSDAEPVWRFFQQWFGVWQHRTGQPGEYCTAADALAGFEARLTGAAFS